MIDNTKFGENTLYVQKMFSTVDTRNFGRMGENVAKAARMKGIELANKGKSGKFTEEDARRLERMSLGANYKSYSPTSQRTERIHQYEVDKNTKGWNDVDWDPNSRHSIYNSPEEVRSKMKEAEEYEKKFFFKGSNKKKADASRKEAFNAYWRWRNGVPKYVKKASATPPPYKPNWDKVATEFKTPPPHPQVTPPPYVPSSGKFGGTKLSVKIPKSK